MESSTPDKQQVRVTILSRPYTLLASGDPREVEEVAASVDALMLSIAAKAPNADSTRIAVLACMHLADRLRLAERELAELRQRGESHQAEYSVLLDLAMPGMNGEETLRALRNSDPDVPVVICTGNGQSDLAARFRAAADGLLQKPFTIHELAAKVTAVLSRTRGGNQA